MIPSFFYFDYVENKLVSSTMQHYFSFILFTFYQSTNKCCKHSQKSYQVSKYRLLNQIRKYNAMPASVCYLLAIMVQSIIKSSVYHRDSAFLKIGNFESCMKGGFCKNIFLKLSIASLLSQGISIIKLIFCTFFIVQCCLSHCLSLHK